MRFGQDHLGRGFDSKVEVEIEDKGWLVLSTSGFTWGLSYWPYGNPKGGWEKNYGSSEADARKELARRVEKEDYNGPS